MFSNIPQWLHRTAHILYDIASAPQQCRCRILFSCTYNWGGRKRRRKKLWRQGHQGRMALNRQIYIRGVQKDLSRASRWQRLPLNFSRAWQTGAWPTSEINGQRMELLMLMLWKNMPNAQQNYQILDQTKLQNIKQTSSSNIDNMSFNHTLPLECGLVFSFNITIIYHPIFNEVSDWTLLLGKR